MLDFLLLYLQWHSHQSPEIAFFADEQQTSRDFQNNGYKTVSSILIGESIKYFNFA